MALQHHFVVIMNEDGSAEIDWETEINNDNSTIWDTEKLEWYHHTEEEVAEANEKATLRLQAILNQPKER